MRRLQAAAVLKRLPRSGWLMMGVPQAESVAEHSFATATLALALTDAVNHDPAGQGLTRTLDAGLVAQIALVHDLAESAITDLPHKATRYLGKDAKYRAEEQALQDIAGDLGSERLLPLWQAYTNADGPEARLVRDADKLEMVHQALVYELAGQCTLEEFWQGHQWHYPLSALLYAELVARRPRR
jgi:putative hydrolase of HD superfamily